MKKLFSRNKGQLTYFLLFLMYFRARNTINSFVFVKEFTTYYLLFDIFCFGQKKLLKSEISKSRHDMVFLMLFSESLSKNTQKNNLQLQITYARNFILLLNRNVKIHSSGKAKSRRDEAKRMSDSNSAAKTTQKMIIIIVFQNILFCNAV